MSSEAPQFTAWLDDFFASYYRLHPVNATFIGVHHYDHLLPERSAEALTAAAAETRALLARLHGLPDEHLSAAERIDKDLAEGYLEIQAWEFDGDHMHRANPSLALNEFIFGVVSLMLRPFAPLSQRLDALAARLEAAPAYLAQVQSLIHSAPEAWTARAGRECLGALALLEGGIDRYLTEVGTDHPEVRRTAPIAAAAVSAFQRWLNDLQVGGSAGCGAEALSLIVRRAHWLPEDLDAILATAELQAAQELETLEAGAAEFKAADWRIAVSQLEALHPSTADYLPSFAKVWDAARSAAIEADLISWPEYPIRYVLQYGWARQAAPYLYFLPYRAPAAFDAVSPMEYLVPPIDDQMPEEEQLRRLRAVNDSVILQNHVVHHGGLGHHLQNFHAYRAQSRIGRVAAVDCASRIAMLCGGTMAEGWACYTTELMGEIGFLTPLQRYAEHLARLRMAMRAIVDVRLHRREITLDQAAALYSDRVGMAEPAAQAEAVKNSMYPGAALMYMTGVDGIRRLRREAEIRTGSAFSLRAFHDRLLSYGSIPIARIAQEEQESGPAV